LLRALLAALIIGVVGAALGVFVVFNRMSFFTDAIAHSALTGIAIGVLFNVTPFWVALVFGVLVGLGVVYLKNSGRFSSDTVLGLLMPFSMALGVILISLKPGYVPELLSYLFGSILAVSWSDLWFEMLVGGVALIWLGFNYQPLLHMSFDRESAQASGVNVVWLEYIFVAILSAVVVASLQVVGIILVGALIVIPAAAAKNLARSFSQVLWLAIVIGILSGGLGLFFSLWLDIASGPAIVVMAMLIFVITFVVRRK